MAIPETIVADQDVIDCVGSLANLAQLLDKDGDGLVDADTLLAARRRATIEVLGMVENQSQIENLEAPYPRLWVLCAGWLAVLNVWLAGTQGQAFPVKYQAEVDNVRQKVLPLIRTGKAGNVADRQPGINQSMTQVTHNSAFTLDRTRGLW